MIPPAREEKEEQEEKVEVGSVFDVFSDETQIGGKTWKQMKRATMEDNYSTQKWFVSETFHW